LHCLQSFLKQSAKASKGTAFSWAVTFCLNVFAILKHLSFEGSFHLKKEKKKSAGSRSGEQGGWLSPQYHVWIEMSPLLVQNGDIIVQLALTALCSKLWPQPGNVLQQSSDNLNAESTTDCLSFRHKFFMDHTLIFKKCDQHGFDGGFQQTKLFGLW
jgi:hypothetical protein